MFGSKKKEVYISNYISLDEDNPVNWLREEMRHEISIEGIRVLEREAIDIIDLKNENLRYEEQNNDKLLKDISILKLRIEHMENDIRRSCVYIELEKENIMQCDEIEFLRQRLESLKLKGK